MSKIVLKRLNINKRAMVRLCVILLLPIFVATLSCETHRSRSTLTVSSYEIVAEKVAEPVRIVQLSDVHNCNFGENNSLLLEMVAAQEPDLILMTGDLINRHRQETSVAEALIKELCLLAPVYVSIGNHEERYEVKFDRELTPIFEASGATVLEKEYVDLEIRGQKIRLGGSSGYCLAAKYLKSGEAKLDECIFLSDFQDTDRYTILMCHIPITWMINGSLEEWDVDCVFAGHAHGGQVRLPGLGGIHVSDLGWFPGRLEGLFYSEDGSKVLVLSRGIGSGAPIPRLNNLPEIVVVDIV